MDDHIEIEAGDKYAWFSKQSDAFDYKGSVCLTAWLIEISLRR